MRIDLSGKTAIISGSTAGIGLATATGLAPAGAKVVVNGRTPEAGSRGRRHCCAWC
jgi:NAD(P)-dependent dehydrogenase (short-subunit alcohol dehydrogenase family)